MTVVSDCGHTVLHAGKPFLRLCCVGIYSCEQKSVYSELPTVVMQMLHCYLNWFCVDFQHTTEKCTMDFQSLELSILESKVPCTWQMADEVSVKSNCQSLVQVKCPMCVYSQGHKSSSVRAHLSRNALLQPHKPMSVAVRHSTARQ